MIRKRKHLLLIWLLVSATSLIAKTPEPVAFTHGTLEVPTYTFERSQDVAPLFQIGNSKGAYPYAALERESLSTEPVPIKYESLTLENEYLRVVVLPELGGRLWSAWDKIAERNIFYYTSVIKPSYYNHRGGWPVGNLEVYGPFDAHMLTWPGEPWSWATTRGEDGSVSIVLSHIEHFFRNKVSMEVTLQPGRAFIDVGVKLHNRKSLPNRYLLWTNAGIPATDGTRYLYPMTKTIGHDTEEYGSWPVFEEVDLSWYRNNKAMLGVFGLDIYDNFIAAYDYQADYGTICYTNRQIARGIKTWTWGVSQTANRHARSYTDSDGHYLEVQSGRFVWDGNYEFINPGKTDGWTEYWFGLGGIGGLTTATRDVGLHLVLEETSREAVLKLTSTGDFPNARLSWSLDGELLGKEPIGLAVGRTVERKLDLGDGTLEPLRLRIESDGNVLLDYTHRLTPQGEFASDSIPREFGPNEELTTEEIFQKGLTHEKLGQISDAIAAYEAALERDPNYTAPNLHLGLLALTRFQDDQAIDHFTRVLDREPSNGDAHYYLAVVHAERGELDEAEKHFYRLLPSSGKFEQRDYGLGVIALRKGSLSDALEFLSSAVENLPTQISARQAYAYALRKAGRDEAAARERDELLRLDPTNAFVWSEQVLNGDGSKDAASGLARATTSHSQGFLELATEYMLLGAWGETLELLDQALVTVEEAGGEIHPLVYYYRAFSLAQMGQRKEAEEQLARVSSQPYSIYIFPFRRETVLVLREALELRPEDANAASLLGALLYERTRREEAEELWQKALLSDPDHYQTLRNLGWAMMERGEVDRALPSLERAAGLRPDDLEIISGATQIYTRLGRPEDALRVVRAALEKRPENDQLLELMARAEAVSGDYDGALARLRNHQFGPRHQSYSLLRLYQSVQLLKAYQLASGGSYEPALRHLAAAENTPVNLGIDDFVTLKSSRLLAFEALVHRAAGNAGAMETAWREAIETVDQDYNGQGLFRAIALANTGRSEEAEAWFDHFELVNAQRKKDRTARVKTEAFYLAGIYSIFRGEEKAGRENFEKAMRADEGNLFARQAQLWLDAGLFEGISGEEAQ